MKFEEFWQLLSKTLSGSMNFETLDQNKAFLCRYYVGEIIITPESSGGERPIDKIQFQRVWRRACKLSKEEQFKPGSYPDITVNASYIVALIKHIVKQENIECEPAKTRARRWSTQKVND